MLTIRLDCQVRLEESGSLAQVACEVEITECEPLHDGRFHIEVSTFSSIDSMTEFESAPRYRWLDEVLFGSIDMIVYKRIANALVRFCQNKYWHIFSN